LLPVSANFIKFVERAALPCDDNNGSFVPLEGLRLLVLAKQLDQINNFFASGVDAIVVNPVRYL